MVIATHEMGFARDIADRVCFLDAGRILEQGPPAQIFATRASRGRASSSSGSSRPAGSRHGRRARRVAGQAGPRAASTKTLNSRSKAGGVDSVRSGWHWTPMRNRPSAASRPSTRSPAGLLGPGVGDEPRREVRRPDGLVVVRVDAQDAAAGVGREQDPGQPRARRDAERMGLRRAGAPARALVPVDVLEERAARERVDRLEAAAQAEHRQRRAPPRPSRPRARARRVRLHRRRRRGSAGRSAPDRGRRRR